MGCSDLRMSRTVFPELSPSSTKSSAQRIPPLPYIESSSKASLIFALKHQLGECVLQIWLVLTSSRAQLGQARLYGVTLSQKVPNVTLLPDCQTSPKACRVLFCLEELNGFCSSRMSITMHAFRAIASREE